MICDGCGRESFHLSYRYSESLRRTACTCSNCGSIGKRPDAHDIYLGRGETSNPQIWNKEQGRPYEYQTKGEKSAIMKKLGIVEAGDRIHGGR